MAIKIKFNNSSRKLSLHSKVLIDEIQHSIRIIQNKLPIDNFEITVEENPNATIPEIGIGGYAPDVKTIYIYLDLDHAKLKEAIQSDLISVLAHESHHIMRWRGPGYGSTLLEALVTEGLADHFDIEITNRKEPPPWSVAMHGSELETMKLQSSLELNSTGYNHSDWFFGSKKRGIPRWTGYTLGFQLVSNYLKKNPEFKSSQLYSKKAEEFIK